MEFVTGGYIAAFRATLLLLAVWAAAARFGGLLLSWFPEDAALSREEKALFSAGLGICAISFAVFAAGLAGKLYSTWMWGLLAAFFILPFLRKKNAFSFPALVFPGPVWQKAAFVCMAFVAALAWIQATLPPIATDALSYHLYHPKLFALHHKLYYVPFSRESLWPYLTEMLYTLSLLIEGTTLTQLFQWSFYLLTGWGVFLLARRAADEKTAWLSALIFLSIPAAFAQSGVPYVDLSFAFFILLAVYPLILYGASPGGALVLLSGLLTGAACATKYLGLCAGLVLFIFWAIETRLNAKLLFYFLLGCALTGAAWYVRSWIVLGNPTYPFFGKYFGGHGYEFDVAANVGRETGFYGFAKLLWNMTFYPASFGGQMLGPFFLMLLPLLIFSTKKMSRAAVWLILFPIFYTCLLYRQSQHLRFYLSAAPFLSVGAGYAAQSFLQKKDILSRILAGVLAFLFALHLGIFVYRVRDALPVLTGKVSAHQYLLGHQRSFRAFDFVKTNMRPGDRIFNGAEVCYFYSPDPDLPIYEIPFRLWLATKRMSLSDYLKKENFRFILYGDGAPSELAHFIRETGYQEILSYDFYEKPALFHYQVYETKA